MTKSSLPVTQAFVPLIAEGLIIRSSLSDAEPTRTTMKWSLKLGRPLTIRLANSGGLEHPSPTFLLKDGDQAFGFGRRSLSLQQRRASRASQSGKVPLLRVARGSVTGPLCQGGMRAPAGKLSASLYRDGPKPERRLRAWRSFCCPLCCKLGGQSSATHRR